MAQLILHHVGIAVTTLDAAIPVWEAIVGATSGAREIVDSQGVEVVFLGFGPGRIELIAPTRSDSPVTRFLDRHGPGMHHLCYEVRNLRQSLSDFAGRGHQLIDREPRRGAGGHLVAFLHPRDSTGVLIELLEGLHAPLVPSLDPDS